MSTLLGLDIGGGGGRALLLDSESGAITTSFEPWTFPVATDTGGVGFDADLDAIFSALCIATRRALAASRVDPSDVVSLAVSAMRFGSVILGEEGEVLYAGPNRDGRAALQGITLASRHGAELAERTGRFPNPGFAVARVLWLAQSDPERFARARHLLSLNDWVAYALCGEIATDSSQAVETGIFDLRAGDWPVDLCERIGLSAAILPEVREAGSRLGALEASVAERLGLAPGIAVAVGGADTQCGLLGAGVVEPGHVGIVAGTTAPLQWVRADADIDPEHRIWSGRHVVSGRHLLEANPGPVGEALDWAGRMLHPDSPAPAAALLAHAAQGEPGAEGILSTFGAGIQDATKIQLPIGSFTLGHLLTPGEPGRPEVARAVVEGLCHGLKKNLGLLEALAGDAPEGVVLTGGLSRSDFFAQLLCDVLGFELQASDCHESSALGAALCGGVAAGVFASLEEGALQLARSTRRFEPEPVHREAYAARFADWDRLREAQAEANAVGQQIEMTRMLSRAGEAGAESPPARRTRILITASMDDEALVALGELGDVSYRSFRETHTLLTGPSLVEALEGHEVLICEVDPVDTKSVLACKDLRVIASCRGDPVNIDIPGMSALGIPVINAPGRNAEAVADVTVGFALALARRLVEANEFLRDEEVEAGDLGKLGAAFGKLQGRELWRKTFGLVGFGAIGRRVAERLVPFGAQVIVHDPFVSAEQAALHGARKVELPELLRESDFVSLHLPVNESTEGMIGEAQLRAMKPGAFFINTARAALVDEEALVAALEDGPVAGAAIDVFSVEPPGWDHPLLALDNVIATPHIGGNTHEVAAHQGRIIADDLRRILRGERPRHALNPECLEGFDLDEPRREPSAEELAALADSAGPAVSDLQKKKEASKRRAEAAPSRELDGEEEDEMASGIPEAERQTMARICREFVQGILGDAGLADRAPQQIALHFDIDDLGEQFWFGFQEGATHGGMGAPREDADVQLKMKAYILDGMFTGKLNAMEKAMEGELSFMGDAAKAMTIQDMQEDLGRIYREAREKVGDPGDLESFAKSASGRRKGRGAAPGAAAVAVGRRRVGDARDDLCDVVDELYRIELITATGGNVSVRIPGEDAMWITPSAMFKGNLDPEIMVKVGMDGKKIGEGGSPSSESMVHIAVYRSRPRTHAVIHCHAAHATILANTDLPFLPISTEAAFFGEIPRLPFIMPGTPELAEAVGEAARDAHAVLLKNHGLVVAGMSLRKAADMAEVVERSAEIILGCYAVGKEPPVLPDDVVAQLREMGEMMA